MTAALECFKAYDIRGRIPDQLNEDIAYRIGRAFAAFIQPSRTVIGHDIRHSSPDLSDAVCRGLRDGGSDVLDIGLCGTEEVYFATFHHNAAGGIMVTASHNPMDYNGLKLVRESAKPISGDTGLADIRQLAETYANELPPAADKAGDYQLDDDKSAYIEHLLGYIDRAALKPLKVVVNAGNGGAGLVIDKLEPHLPLEFVKVYHEPDGSFPNGIPNPLLPENRAATSEAVRAHGADFGLAWDGDFDRCFFFDERGEFIEGYYLVGLLAQAALAHHAGGRVIHDPRLVWNTQEMVEQAGGVAVQCKSGHAFIKERMRQEDAIYGGEMSAHHYFRDFSYCDSGMITWLLVAELLSKAGAEATLSAMVAERVARFPCSGEINFRVADAQQSIDKVLAAFAADNPALDRTDGVSAEFADWRFNLRASNTEPLLRLNVEARGPDATAVLAERTDQLRQLLQEDR